jgi:conjugal transfer pilin signal peptidase TrbI
VTNARPVQRGPFFVAVFAVMLIVWLYWSKPPYALAFDPNDEKCIPDLHLSLLHKFKPAVVRAGDLVFWLPSGAVNYVKQEFVLKQVAGVAGDHLVVKDQKLFVNGKLMVTGLPLASLYKRTPVQLERDELIPAGKVLVLGTAALSDDSRYWGYLDLGALSGVAYKLL